MDGPWASSVGRGTREGRQRVIVKSIDEHASLIHAISNIQKWHRGHQIYPIPPAASSKPRQCLLLVSLSLSLSPTLLFFLGNLTNCSGMKKLYRRGSVHPSPPNKLDQLTFLPTAILTLAAALSPEEKEVLAYLISCSNSSGNSFSKHHQDHRRGSSSSSSFARTNTTGSTSSGDHPPSFKCDCFRCYMSYWARWDSSPNRQLIHEIIDAFEDWLVQSSMQSSKKSRKERKKKGSDGNNSNSNSNNNRSTELKQSGTSQKNELAESDSVIESSSSGGGDGGGGSSCAGAGAGGGDEGEVEGKGSVRRLMNFIGESIWGVWGSSI